MVDKNGVRLRLKEATQITGISWVAHLERNIGKWQYLSAYRLTNTRKSALETYLQLESVDSWLCGALGSRTSRSRQVQDVADLDCVRLYAFPIQGTPGVLLVGGGQQDNTTQRVWKLVANTLVKEETEEPEVSPVVTDTLVPAIQEGVPFDLPDALDRMLALIAQQVPCQGAWLAIRRGDVLEIQSHWRSPQCKGITLGIESNEILQGLSKTLKGISIERGKKGWEKIPKVGIKSTTGVWGCVPLVVGQRFIGAVCLWRLRAFTNQEWKQFVETVVRSAPSVEVVITFTELGGHLRRLAMLNDFVLTVSSVQSLLQISKRVFALLSRAFQTEFLSLFLLSTDERTVREYRNENGKITSTIESLAGHPFGEAFGEGIVLNLSRESDSGALFRSEKTLSMIVVPLKYRGRVNGLLVIESSRLDSFSVYDVHLITVIAGHLAGLVEYSRLREEAESRARNLGLIHEVVQEVIGLVNKQEVVQITAELLVQYFGYEFVIILLVDEDKQPTICGIGGSRAPSAKTILSELAGPVAEKGGGITRHVLATGESMLVNDVSESKIYRSLRGWDAGSELCLALSEGDRVIGVIDIESGSKNSFGQNDFIALESLAGILSNVLSNADQYQRLQESVRQLRQIQQELQTRIEAQLEAEQKLIQAEKLAAVGEMAAGIAHELNNPLTTVTGFTELVIEDLPNGADNRTDLELVLREAKRARDVVRRLLDFSRRSESERTRVDLNELIGDVVSLTNHLMQTQDVSLELGLGKDLPWVSVDRNQIKQVFLNLFHNSLQAMPGGGKLTIQTGKRQRDGRKWVLATVADTGDGISEENKARIFEPFFTTRSDQGGTGLGLSVTYSIISNHGGIIEVDSQPKQGTKFSVWFPY
jgi:signal transduction histidine kinase